MQFQSGGAVRLSSTVQINIREMGFRCAIDSRVCTVRGESRAEILAKQQANGHLVSNSHRIIANEKVSALAVTVSPWISSGDMYPGVPTPTPTRPSGSLLLFAPASRDIEKSHTLTVLPWSQAISKLDDLRSL